MFASFRSYSINKFRCVFILQTLKRIIPSVQSLLTTTDIEAENDVSLMYDGALARSHGHSNGHSSASSHDDAKGGDGGDEKPLLPESHALGAAPPAPSGAAASAASSSSSSSNLVPADNFRLASIDSQVGIMLTQTPVTLNKLRTHVQCLQFAAAFVRDFAAVLKLPLASTFSTVRRLLGVELRSQSTLQLLLRVFGELNKEYARVGGELECVFCSCVPRDPVRFCGRAECRRLVCRSCVEDFLASATFKQSKQCFWCRQVNPPPMIVDERDRRSVADSAVKEKTLQAAASRKFIFV